MDEFRVRWIASVAAVIGVLAIPGCGKEAPKPETAPPATPQKAETPPPAAPAPAAPSEAPPAPAKAESSAPQPKSDMAASAPSAAAGGAPAASSGEGTYKKACATCHDAGIAGAPKVGDKTAWAPRIKEGTSTLYSNAIKGKGAHPPKGGSSTLTDDEVKAAVDYMVSKSE